MEVVEGQLPRELGWRVLLPVEAGHYSPFLERIATELARANHGDVVAVVVLRDRTEKALGQARERLARLTEVTKAVNGVDLYCLILAPQRFVEALMDVVDEADIDLLLVEANHTGQHDYRKVPCAVGMYRGTAESAEDGEGPLDRILVPTSAGPNSAYALGLLLPLAPKTALTALYVAPERLGPNEEMLGHSRLQQAVDFVDGGDKIEACVVTADTVASGIVNEASGDYDLVVIGASEESRLDQVIFGNIPAAVIQECRKPVLMVRRSRSRLTEAVNWLDWQMQRVIPRKSVSERAEIYARIRRGARPETPFFVLTTLSATIASFGLIVGSPAVVIGAMLVAPLMSPIIGTGLALVLGNTRFLRLALGAVSRGVLLAIFVGFLAGLTAVGRPFTSEILGRTQPNLFDLGIAIFSGAAGAYAVGFSQAAAALPGVAIAAALVPPLATVGVTLASAVGALLGGRYDVGLGQLGDSLGALLLFTTNFIAIATAAAVVFFIMGFRPAPSQKERVEVQRRSATVALSLLILVGVILAGTSYVLARESRISQRIQIISEEQVADVTGATLVTANIIEHENGVLRLGLSVISPGPIPYAKVVELQESMAQAFQDENIATELGLTMLVDQVTELDPRVPPEPTAPPLP